jgi:hypothetical protein
VTDRFSLDAAADGLERLYDDVVTAPVAPGTARAVDGLRSLAVRGGARMVPGQLRARLDTAGGRP